MVEVVVELIVEAFDVLERRDNLLQVVVLIACMSVIYIARRKHDECLLLPENRVVHLKSYMR